MLADPRLPSGGPGRADNGNFVLSELKLKASPKSDPSKAEPIELQSAVADFSQEGWPVANAIDGKMTAPYAYGSQEVPTSVLEHSLRVESLQESKP